MEIEIFRHEIECLREHMLPLVRGTDSKLTSLEEKMTGTGTENAECMNMIRELRHGTNNLLETWTASEQEINPRLTRVADRLSKLEEAVVEFQNHKPLSENRSAGKPSSKRSSCKRTRQSKRFMKKHRADEDPSADSPSDKSSDGCSDSDDGTSSGYFSDNEDEIENEDSSGRRPEWDGHKSHVQSHLGDTFKKLGRKHPRLKELRPTYIFPV